MTIKELINELKDLPENMEIIMSKDGEGNSFSPLYEIGTGLYVAYSTWSGEVYNEDDKEEVAMGNSDAKANNTKPILSIILWPTN